LASPSQSRALLTRAAAIRRLKLALYPAGPKKYQSIAPTSPNRRREEARHAAGMPLA